MSSQPIKMKLKITIPYKQGLKVIKIFHHKLASVVIQAQKHTLQL